jgi:hypothetical protein
MTTKASPPPIVLTSDVHLSFFAKKRDRGVSRVSTGRLLDISNAGLCMEVATQDSDLFMESQGKLFTLTKTVDIQIFCRSHPTNVCVEGHVHWVRSKDAVKGLDNENSAFVGILFSFESSDQKKDLDELVEHLTDRRVRCGECGAGVSDHAALCYNCGSRLVRRRTLFRGIIDGLLAGKKTDTT